jgi:nondiscriminating glutamyl-tRNA synthetase
LTAEQQAAFEAEGRKPSIRFAVLADRQYEWDDMVKGSVSFDSNGIGDFVIVKKDGIPTYNFAVAADDHDMAISHVLRGDDHISNTPKQLMVYEALGFEPPVFGHMTLICNENRKKLSKRDESIIQFIEQYEQLGYLPEALFNFIALLGWSPGGEEEIFSKEELIGMFDTARLSKSPAVFDTQKLEWLNNQYMKQQPLERIVELSLPHLVKAGRIEENLTPEKQEWVNRLAGLFKDQMSYGAEIVSLSELFFTEEVKYDAEAEEVLSGETVPQVMESFLAKVQESDTLEPDDVKAMLKAVQKETGQKGKNLFMPVRVAATGQVHGPDLLVSIALLGKERVVSRLENVIKKISKA